MPALGKHLAQARRVSEVRVDGDYSYATRAYAGERWLLAGDAGSFLDPVFSTGVLLALASGTQAAEAVDGALAAGAGSRRAARALAATSASSSGSTASSAASCSATTATGSACATSSSPPRRSWGSLAPW